MLKNLVCLITIAAGLLLGATTVAAATRVFLIAGQSNAAGVGGYPEDIPCPAPYNAAQSGVKFWNYNPIPATLPFEGYNDPGVGDGWSSLRPGFGYTNYEFGPEVSFGYTLHNLFPRDQVYLVKYAISSQDLAVCWNPNGTHSIYPMFKARVNAAMANLAAAGLNPQIDGMIWMQGEMDADNAYSATAAASYATNLTSFIARVRSDFDSPDMRFVVGRVLDYYDTTPPGGAAMVRNAQMTVPALVGNASWIDTDDLERAYSGHYGTQGQIDLGIRFANQFVMMPEPPTLLMVSIAVLGVVGRIWCSRRKETCRHDVA